MFGVYVSRHLTATISALRNLHTLLQICGDLDRSVEKGEYKYDPLRCVACVCTCVYDVLLLIPCPIRAAANQIWVISDLFSKFEAYKA